MLISIGDVVGRWKEYFEDFFNFVVTFFEEEAEVGDSEADLFIILVEVIEVVGKFFGGKVSGVDEIRFEYFKFLDVVGLFWLIRFCNIAWRFGIVFLDW